MKIREYLDQNNLTIKNLAEHVGCTWQYVWMIIKEKYNPSIQLAHQISIWSNGKIKVHEIRKCNKNCEPGCACSKGR